MKFFFILYFLLNFTIINGQNASQNYGLYIINHIDTLRHIIAIDSNKAFVKIKDIVPEIVVDIKYATKQNIFYEKLYDHPYAIIRLPVAKALKKVQEDLKLKGIGLKIYDAYRPYRVTCRMWDLMPDSIYMGNPVRGSHHNRGIALDLTLIDLASKKELKMPTPFDALIYASHPNYMNLPDTVIKNRTLLISTMYKYNFRVDPVEWWHFNFIDGINYELLNIPQKQIIKSIKKNKIRG